MSFVLTVLLAVLGMSGGMVGAAIPSVPPADASGGFHYTASEHCPPLDPPTGDPVNVSTEGQLWNAVNTAQEGDTILLADGTYNLGQNGHYLWIDTPNVTLRSASGNRESVILDDNYTGSEIVTILASNVTVADLTIKRAGTHPIHVTSSDGGNTLNTLIYNVHIIDPGQQAIKINPHEARVHYPDYGEVACSHIELTDAGRAEVWEINGRCYTGGVDGHWARGWVIRDSVIEGFWCDSGLSEHGVHMWRGCRDTVVERNLLFDNARGVGFGMMTSGSARTYGDDPCPGITGYVGHYGGIVRNNFIFAGDSGLLSSDSGFDSGVAIWQACEADVLHNTVVSLAAPTTASEGSIEWRFSNATVDLINNLVSHNMVARDGASGNEVGNLTYQPLSLFVDGTNGDLHLLSTATDAIDQGASVAAGLCDDDIDGDARPIGAAPDVGADEYGAPPPDAVTDLRVTNAVTGTGVLTPTLRWTAPARAVTYTLRCSDTAISDANWGSAVDVSVPFTATPGSIEWLTPTVAYDGGAIYFALKSQGADGAWSPLSNNAIWFVPTDHIFLPVVIRTG